MKNNNIIIPPRVIYYYQNINYYDKLLSDQLFYSDISFNIIYSIIILFIMADVCVQKFRTVYNNHFNTKLLINYTTFLEDLSLFHAAGVQWSPDIPKYEPTSLALDFPFFLRLRVAFLPLFL